MGPKEKHFLAKTFQKIQNLMFGHFTPRGVL
jgi:hypothetical protein